MKRFFAIGVSALLIVCDCTWGIAADCTCTVPAKSGLGGSPNAYPSPGPLASIQTRQRRQHLAAELGWVNFAATRLAIEDLAVTFKSAYSKKTEYLAMIDRLESERPKLVAALSGTISRVEERAAEFLRQAREPLLANPLLDPDRILLLRRTFPDPAQARHAMGGNAGLISLNAHTSDTIPRQGLFKDELTVLSSLRGKPCFTTVYAPANGDTMIDPVLHYDGTKLLFARNGEREKNWRLFEIRLDGKGLHQVTPDDGADVGHFDPCYLPDGRIIFASTAAYQGLPCEFGGNKMVCLYQLDPATGKVRQLTFEQDSDWSPRILHNGRVLYQRWEYTDQSHSNSRMLFHMNPDGTDQREYRGSGSWFPNSFFFATPIPGHSRQVIGIAGGHHGVAQSGRLLILDPGEGRHDAEGIVQEIPGRGKKVDPIVRDGLVNGVWPQFLMPCPLSTKYHVVTAKLTPDSLWGLYLVDTFDNMTLIHEFEGAALFWPTLVQKKETPLALPDRIDPATNECSVLINDIYSGPGLAGVERGAVKKVRLVEYYFARRGMGGLYGTLGMDGPWDIKRVLGTVPVEPDGSVFFKMPANTPVSFQPVDEKGEALQLMRSWLVGMPGENVSCIGCHESQNAAPANKKILAQTRPPSPIQPWHGPVRGFSFVREVQPVLDQYCVRCHDGSKPNRPFLKGGEMITDWKTQMPGHWGGGGKFTRSYAELHRFVRRPGIEGDRRMFTPMEFHFSSTALGQLLRKGHYGVALDPEGWERLTAWADLNAPFHGTWGEILPSARVATVIARSNELRKRYVPMGPFPDYEAIPVTEPYNPKPVLTAKAKPTDAPVPSVPNWPFDKAAAQAKQLGSVGTLVSGSLDLGDGISLALQSIPGGAFAMGALDGHPDERPVTAVTVKPFWMGRFEVTNRQYCQYDPAHESRTEDRHGYQFGVTGYDEDQPEQPVVRVSWKEALGFCQWLAKRTGRKVTLPTEAQWEWACRAGASSPFWYGDLNTNFAPFANLGDAMLAQFVGNPYVQDRVRAAAKDPSPYDNWIPQDARFNDGGFVTEPVGKYQPNPWGLHDMHGNAAEWTLSAYAPYPYREEDGRNSATSNRDKVARGGSWYDRPKCATSTYRVPYATYQRVYNVGFRVIVDEAPADPPPTAATGVRHRFLKSGCNSGSVAIVGPTGEIEWEFPLTTNVSDSAVLANGNIAFTFDSGAREMRRDHTIIWEYTAPKGAEVHSCQPLPNGMFLIGESYANGKSAIHEVGATGKIVKTLLIDNESGNAHSQFRQVRKTKQGTYLITQQRNGGTAKEYDSAGKLLRSFPGGRFVAIRLDNGNTLIGGGDEHRVLEVDPQNKIVWQIDENEIPGNKIGFAAGLQRLPNGNTVVCNWAGHSHMTNQPQVFEVTPAKKVVWEVNNPKLKMVSSIQILDAPGYGSTPGPQR